MVPRSRSRVIERVVTKSVENNRTMPINPGTMFNTVNCSGLYRAYLELERRAGGRRLKGRRQVAVEGGRNGQRRGGIADRRRIGRVGVHQHRRLLAAIHRAVEIRRYVDDEQDVAIGQRPLRLKRAASHRNSPYFRARR